MTGVTKEIAATREAKHMTTMSEWQGISSAPRDGTVFQGWVVREPSLHHSLETYWEPRVRWKGGCWQYRHSHGWFDLNMFTADLNSLSHWMPLPPPPTGDEA